MLLMLYFILNLYLFSYHPPQSTTIFYPYNTPCEFSIVWNCAGCSVNSIMKRAAFPLIGWAERSGVWFILTQIWSSRTNKSHIVPEYENKEDGSTLGYYIELKISLKAMHCELVHCSDVAAMTCSIIRVFFVIFLRKSFFVVFFFSI